MASILIIEDEEDIVELVKYNLNKEGFKLASSNNGTDGLKQIKTIKPNLILLDIMLPGMNGIEILKQIKKDDSLAEIPVIMLTAKTEESDVVIGLELGADDYITKPFSPKILASRIKAVLKRYTKPATGKFTNIGHLTIDESKHKVTVLKKEIKLTLTEFKILTFLANRPDIVVGRDKLLNGVFGYESDVFDRTVDAHIKSLRKKLGKCKNYIETVRGLGYKFKEIK
jgi:two-component system phosphate regulon response regulator PhoB